MLDGHPPSYITRLYPCRSAKIGKSVPKNALQRVRFMGVMNKMRDNTGAILWVLVVAFGVIFMLQDTNVFDSVANSSLDTYVRVNGEPISYQEYQSALDGQLDDYQRRFGNDMPLQVIDFARDQVFDQLVMDKLLEQEMDAMGIEVSAAEVRAMVFGPTPHPLIRTYFGDGNGGIDRAVLENAATNPEAREAWIQIESILRNDRRRQKMQSLIQSSVRVSDAEVQSVYEGRNTTVDVRFVALRYAGIPTDSISVTDGDLRAYYNANKDDYLRPERYEMSWVMVSKRPTSSDTARVVEDVTLVRPRFEAAASDSLFLLQNGSDTPYSAAYFTEEELSGVSEDVASVVFGSSETNVVFGPIVDGGVVRLVKVVDRRRNEEGAEEAQVVEFGLRIRASGETLREARSTLDDLLYFAEDVNDFEGEAAKAGLSVRNMIVQSDQPQLPDGIGYSRALMNFLASAEEGAFSEVIELNQDFIAVQLMERTPEGHAAFEEVQAQIRPLVVTQKKRAIISGRLASAIATGDFNTLAERVGTIERTAQQIAANTTNVPGVGREPAFVGAALGTAEGAISGVVEGQAAAFVLLIERRNEAPAMTDASKNAIAQSIRAERIQTLSQEWLESLKAEADIEDNRLRFEVQ